MDAFMAVVGGMARKMHAKNGQICGGIEDQILEDMIAVELARLLQQYPGQSLSFALTSISYLQYSFLSDENTQVFILWEHSQLSV